MLWCKGLKEENSTSFFPTYLNNAGSIHYHPGNIPYMKPLCILFHYTELLLPTKKGFFCYPHMITANSIPQHSDTVGQQYLMNQREGVEWGGRGRRKVGGQKGRGERGEELAEVGAAGRLVVHYKFFQGNPQFPNLIPPGYLHGYILNNTSLEDFTRIDPREVMQYFLHVILNNVLLRQSST